MHFNVHQVSFIHPILHFGFHLISFVFIVLLCAQPYNQNYKWFVAYSNCKYIMLTLRTTKTRKMGIWTESKCRKFSIHSSTLFVLNIVPFVNVNVWRSCLIFFIYFSIFIFSLTLLYFAHYTALKNTQRKKDGSSETFVQTTTKWLYIRLSLLHPTIRDKPCEHLTFSLVSLTLLNVPKSKKAKRIFVCSLFEA